MFSDTWLPPDRTTSFVTLSLEITHYSCFSFYHYPSSGSSTETGLASSRHSLLLSALRVHLCSFSSLFSLDTQGLLSSTDLAAMTITSSKCSASGLQSPSASYFLSLSGQVQCPCGYVQCHSLRVSLLFTHEFTSDPLNGNIWLLLSPGTFWLPSIP